MAKGNGISPLGRLFGLIKADRKDIVRIYVFAVLSGLINLSLPLGIQAIITYISGGMISTSWILLVILVILGIILAGGMQVMQLSLAETIQQRIFQRSSFEFAVRIPRIRLEQVASKYAPELINRFFDTLSLQKGLSKILLDIGGFCLANCLWPLAPQLLPSLLHSFRHRPCSDALHRPSRHRSKRFRDQHRREHLQIPSCLLARRAGQNHEHV